MEPTTKLTKFFSSEVKSVNDQEKTVVAVVSTKKTDRDGDIILPEAFKSRLKVYKDHPVFLSSHKYGSLMAQIGEAVNVKITDAGLEATFKYYVGKGNPEADWAFELAKEGIAAFSVGFIGHDWEPIEDKDSKMIVGRTFTDVELIEISQVVVPSNRGALQMGRAAAAVEVQMMEAVEKSFASGKLTEKAAEKKAEEKQVSEQKTDDGTSAHYTEKILGDGSDPSKPTPDDILLAIRGGFTSVKLNSRRK